MASHNRGCLSGQDRQGGQHRNSGGQHHHIMHLASQATQPYQSKAFSLS